MSEVSVERDGGVATVVMNRPPANAMTPDFVGAICDAVAELGADADVRVIVLRSALERFFMAGADLGNMAARVGSTDAGSRQVGVLSRRISVVERVPKPTIAAINGHALGGGCEIALCCDYRLMVDDGRATIGLTETALGLLPGAGGTQRLPRLVGRGAALKMIIEGRRLKAPEALAIGLVDAAVAPDDLDAAVAAKAAQLAGLATRAVGLAKLALLEGLDTTLDEGLALESKAFAEVLDTEDIKEGVGAFLEKRTPSFRGR
jgi:enoyl-CoA hydratase